MATYVINRLSSPILGNISQFKALFHTKPDYSLFKTFGCECNLFLRTYNANKFNYHNSKYVLLGLSACHKGYLCMSHTGRIYIV